MDAQINALANGVGVEPPGHKYALYPIPLIPIEAIMSWGDGVGGWWLVVVDDVDDEEDSGNPQKIGADDFFLGVGDDDGDTMSFTHTHKATYPPGPLLLRGGSIIVVVVVDGCILVQWPLIWICGNKWWMLWWWVWCWTGEALGISFKLCGGVSQKVVVDESILVAYITAWTMTHINNGSAIKTQLDTIGMKD